MYELEHISNHDIQNIRCLSGSLFDVDFGNFDMLEVTEILEVQISREFGFKGVFYKPGNLGL